MVRLTLNYSERTNENRSVCRDFLETWSRDGTWSSRLFESEKEERRTVERRRITIWIYSLDNSVQRSQNSSKSSTIDFSLSFESRAETNRWIWKARLPRKVRWLRSSKKSSKTLSRSDSSSLMVVKLNDDELDRRTICRMTGRRTNDQFSRLTKLPVSDKAFLYVSTLFDTETNLNRCKSWRSTTSRRKWPNESFERIGETNKDKTSRTDFGFAGGKLTSTEFSFARKLCRKRFRRRWRSDESPVEWRCWSRFRQDSLRDSDATLTNAKPFSFDFLSWKPILRWKPFVHWTPSAIVREDRRHESPRLANWSKQTKQTENRIDWLEQRVPRVKLCFRRFR